jgi:O-acetyl-ADP-ribose deacetylase (regulator of RNase III)
MSSDVFIVHGDLTRLTADAIVLSTSTYMDGAGLSFPDFADRYPELEKGYREMAPHFRGRPIGDAFWVPTPNHLPASGRGGVGGIVVVLAAGDRGATPSSDKASRATAGAIREALAQKELAPEPSGRRRLIALPTFGFGKGGYRDRLACGKEMIAAAVAALAGRPDVDAAFVAYTDLDYEIMLRARRETGHAPAPAWLADLPHQKLIASLRDRHCVLFVGAGLSRPAGLPDWTGLLAVLAERLGLKLGDDTRQPIDFSLDLAQWYVDRLGRDSLEELIQERFAQTGQGKLCGIEPTLAHYFLLSLPVRLVLTTNYDDLLERALRALRRDPLVVTEPREVVLTGSAGLHCVVKFHGDANSRKNFVLTRDDFDGFFDTHPVMSSFLEGLLLNQTFLFFGYGLRDPNTRQIYSRVARLLKDSGRAAFAVSVDEESDTTRHYREQWKNQGLHVLSMPGNDRNERIQNSLRFLDWLAGATVEKPDLLLAPRVEASELPPGLSGLRSGLTDLAGTITAALAEANEDNARTLARVLELLVNLGWRPGPWRRALSELWKDLAQKCGTDESLRRQLLANAVRAAPNGTQADDVRKELGDCLG